MVEARRRDVVVRRAAIAADGRDRRGPLRLFNIWLSKVVEIEASVMKIEVLEPVLVEYKGGR